MAAGYFASGKASERATFELFARRLPHNRNFILAAGLEQAVDYLLGLRFTKEEIEYVRGLPQLRGASPEFFDMLAGLRFTGDLFAVPEGTPLFAGEPFLTVRAPVIEAQIVETYLLATIGFQSLIATKAARVVRAAAGAGVVEFGTRRAQSPEAGVLAGRAAYIGGCEGTSNVEAGFRYRAHVFGTASHSWVMSFASERAAFQQLQALLGDRTTYLIDTYDTLAGEVGLSASAVLRRVRRLEEGGVIARYVALVPPERVGLALTAYINVRLEKQTDNPLRNPRDLFRAAVQAWPEVVECAALTGETDYLLRAVFGDMQHYSRFVLETLLRHPSVADCRSSFVLDRVKSTTSLPV